jgi:hypothetical protein
MPYGNMNAVRDQFLPAVTEGRVLDLPWVPQTQAKSIRKSSQLEEKEFGTSLRLSSLCRRGIGESSIFSYRQMLHKRNCMWEPPVKSIFIVVITTQIQPIQ